MTPKDARAVPENPILKGQETDVLNTTSAELSPLLPDRMDQADFFVCDIFDALPKSDMASMEHPIFSIQTRPDKRTRNYQNGDVSVSIRPDPEHGLPTVHDKDVLIFAISQLVAGMNAGQQPSRTVSLQAYNILKATNRDTGGSDYANLRKALRRLASTKINTNIVTGSRTTEREFSLIDDWGSVRETDSGRLIELTVTLSDWVFRAIENREVLTIDPRYFRLRSPVERRLYELARKHCGRQEKWECGLERLREKVGAYSELKKFRASIRQIVAKGAEHEHLPQYKLTFDSDRDVLIVTPRHEKTAQIAASLMPSGNAIEEGKRRAPGYDIYEIQAQWRQWVAANPRDRFPRENVDGHFLKFVTTHVERQKKLGADATLGLQCNDNTGK